MKVSEYALQQAVDAAAKELFEREHERPSPDLGVFTPWEALPRLVQHRYRVVVTPLVDAAIKAIPEEVI